MAVAARPSSAFSAGDYGSYSKQDFIPLDIVTPHEPILGLKEDQKYDENYREAQWKTWILNDVQTPNLHEPLEIGMNSLWYFVNKYIRSGLFWVAIGSLVVYATTGFLWVVLLGFTHAGPVFIGKDNAIFFSVISFVFSFVYIIWFKTALDAYTQKPQLYADFLCEIGTIAETFQSCIAAMRHTSGEPESVHITMVQSIEYARSLILGVNVLALKLFMNENDIQDGIHSTQTSPAAATFIQLHDAVFKDIIPSFSWQDIQTSRISNNNVDRAERGLLSKRVKRILRTNSGQRKEITTARVLLFRLECILRAMTKLPDFEKNRIDPTAVIGGIGNLRKVINDIWKKNVIVVPEIYDYHIFLIHLVYFLGVMPYTIYIMAPTLMPWVYPFIAFLFTAVLLYARWLGDPFAVGQGVPYMLFRLWQISNQFRILKLFYGQNPAKTTIDMIRSSSDQSANKRRSR